MFPALLAAALVWVPPENFIQWSKVDALLRSKSSVKLTIALTPRMVTPLAKAALSHWITAGRVEIAARISGDPVLPLVAVHPAAPRPDDALELPAEARREIEQLLETKVTGFVPGGGALDASLIGPLSASGLSWVLTGPYCAAGSSWATAGQMVFVPASTATAAAPGPLVIDESAQPDSDSSAVLAIVNGDGTNHGWVKISEFVPVAEPTAPSAMGISAWPGWNPSATTIPDNEIAQAAYRAYGNAAKAVEQYKNSGAADLRILENATTALRKAQEARFFRAGMTKTRGGLPAEMSSHVFTVYRRLKSAAPDALYDIGGRTSKSVGDRPTNVLATFSANILTFENPTGSLAQAPVGVTNSDPWLLRGLRIEWSTQKVTFRIQTARVDTATSPPHAIYDLYIDLNHVLDAGEIRLFDGRSAFAQARDAWEFALSINGPEASLYRAVTGDPEKITTLKTAIDPARKEIRVAVPREFLRGNPSRWGYTLLALAEDPARAARSPAAALIGPDGNQILGILGALDFQKSVLNNHGAPNRIPAIRLDLNSR